MEPFGRMEVKDPAHDRPRFSGRSPGVQALRVDRLGHSFEKKEVERSPLGCAFGLRERIGRRRGQELVRAYHERRDVEAEAFSEPLADLLRETVAVSAREIETCATA